MPLWIVILVVLFVLAMMHPLRIRADLAYEKFSVSGKLQFFLFSYFSKPVFTIWSSDKNKSAKKSKKKNKQKDEDKEKTEEQSDAEKADNAIIQQIKSYLPLLKSCRKIFMSMNGKLDIIYGFYDQFRMATVYPIIFATLPLIFGTPDKTKWRIKVSPIWGADTMKLGLVVDIKITIGKLLSSGIKILWIYLKIRRNENGQTSD